MSTLLIIQSHREAKDQLFRNWPHLQLPGWDILGVVPEDSIHSWPADINHCEIIGKAMNGDGDIGNANYLKRWLATWEKVLNRDTYKDYSDFAMTEYDSIFINQPPAHPGGAFTHLAGGPMSGFKCSKFFHPIWWLSRIAAEIVVEEGKKLFAEGEFEQGSPDCFLGLISDRRPELVFNETGNFSVNGNDFKNRRDQAEKVIPGTWFVHGFRTQQELDWILQHANTAKIA